ncbi:MAG: flagellar motor protein MotB [Pseudomonadota bacterium]
MSNVQPIIKKVKKGGHAHAHSSAWKVAYADFVTAMMAFFLMLWLLNASTEEQLSGIADYFMPTTSTSAPTGSLGFSGGVATDIDGPLNLPPMGMPSVVVGLPPGEDGGEDEASESAAVEDAKFQDIEERLREAIDKDPELAGLEDHLIIDRTDEGLRIQLVDQDDRSMFPRGSEAMLPHTHALLAQVAKAVTDTSNQVAISGHTDATPYRAGSAGDNWTLSSGRANAARRVLVEGGLPEQRLARVTGKASTEPHQPDDPTAASNRRIAIVLLYAGGNRPELANPEVAVPPVVAPLVGETSAAPGIETWRP